MLCEVEKGKAQAYPAQLLPDEARLVQVALIRGENVQLSVVAEHGVEVIVAEEDAQLSLLRQDTCQEWAPQPARHARPSSRAPSQAEKKQVKGKAVLLLKLT